MPAKMLRMIAVAAVCSATAHLPSPPSSRAMRRRPFRDRPLFAVHDALKATRRAKQSAVRTQAPTAIPMSTQRRPIKPIAFRRRGERSRSSTFPGKPPS
jgi:hypothetical protein